MNYAPRKEAGANHNGEKMRLYGSNVPLASEKRPPILGGRFEFYCGSGGRTLGSNSDILS